MNNVSVRTENRNLYLKKLSQKYKAKKQYFECVNSVNDLIQLVGKEEDKISVNKHFRHITPKNEVEESLKRIEIPEFNQSLVKNSLENILKSNTSSNTYSAIKPLDYENLKKYINNFIIEKYENNSKYINLKAA